MIFLAQPEPGMIEKLISFLTMQNILNLISVLAFFISTFTAINQWRNSRRKLKIDLYDYSFGKTDLKAFLFVENNSRLPISLTRFQVFFEKNVLFDCNYRPTLIMEFTRSSGLEVTSRVQIFSDVPPIHMEPLSANKVLIHFRFPEQCRPLPFEKHLNLKVCTNRGTEVLELPLPEQARYLNNEPW